MAMNNAALWGATCVTVALGLVSTLLFFVAWSDWHNRGCGVWPDGMQCSDAEGVMWGIGLATGVLVAVTVIAWKVGRE
jgi:hypothetical protein